MPPQGRRGETENAHNPPRTRITPSTTASSYQRRANIPTTHQLKSHPIRKHKTRNNRVKHKTIEHEQSEGSLNAAPKSEEADLQGNPNPGERLRRTKMREGLSIAQRSTSEPRVSRRPNTENQKSPPTGCRDITQDPARLVVPTQCATSHKTEKTHEPSESLDAQHRGGPTALAMGASNFISQTRTPETSTVSSVIDLSFHSIPTHTNASGNLDDEHECRSP
ncbi:hypothetical protein DFP72DRAFT_847783 [Ephemerocybe angulata]|uniref:Uncharacterized protein n=1 Tax=Ephemerocybe angulata TaxID=980116 RepID=A0A8H6HXU5_9AGAR|nr:hypothetical protein DFP72DRAFT_847783 [Tulosesus angulatus]